MNSNEFLVLLRVFTHLFMYMQIFNYNNYVILKFRFIGGQFTPITVWFVLFFKMYTKENAHFHTIIKKISTILNFMSPLWDNFLIHGKFLSLEFNVLPLLILLFRCKNLREKLQYIHTYTNIINFRMFISVYAVQWII